MVFGRRLTRAGRSGVLAVLTICVAVPRAGMALAQDSAGPDAVARAVFDAMASGNADRFEAVAAERFDAGLLARRTPAERKAMLERIRGDFGALTLERMVAADGGVITLFLKGATGLAGRLELTLATAPPYKVTRMAMEVGGPEERPEGPPPPIHGGMTPAELTSALDGYLAGLADAGRFAGVVAIAKDGVTVFERAYGLANREQAVKATPAIPYNLASIGKAFTKTAIGQLVSQGTLKLTDTIGALLPGYPTPGANRATVEQLLAHQAGIANFFGPAFDAAPKERFASNADYFAFVAPQPLLFEPGTRRDYCNGCYVVLGQIIERVSGLKYEEYIARHVLTPAGMAGAGFFRSDKPEKTLAQGYSRQLPGAGGGLQNARAAHGVAGSAAGGAYATARDLLAFDKAMREGRLLDPKMTAWFLESDVPTQGRRASGGIGIAGGAPGANTLLESDERWAVAVVGNLDPPASVDVGLAIKRQLSGGRDK
jgi:D-alanyl-D-alanine carboxypeptidase